MFNIKVSLGKQFFDYITKKASSIARSHPEYDNTF